MAKKKPSPEPPIVWKEFVLFWWIEKPGTRLALFRTRRPEDIEVLSRSHYRIVFHPDVPEDGDFEVILRRKRDTWWFKVGDDEECQCLYSEDNENAAWTWFDDANQELFMIRGVKDTDG